MYKNQAKCLKVDYNFNTPLQNYAYYCIPLGLTQKYLTHYSETRYKYYCILKRYHRSALQIGTRFGC